ncbi:MAG: hypothetical protein LBV04_05060 [Deferribacteraceae bacterium]|nr:hypothetical protein [Deferribacteraceae bacterium]
MFLFVFSGVVYACDDFDNSKVEINENVYFYDGKPMNGTFCWYEDESGWSGETPLKNGLMHGEVKIEDNGILVSTTMYQNGKQDGAENIYDHTDDNNIAWTIIYKEDKAISGKCANGRQLTSAELNGSPDCSK